MPHAKGKFSRARPRRGGRHGRTGEGVHHHAVDTGLPQAQSRVYVGGDRAELPDDDWDTVGGLVFSTLEHVPVPGEELDFEGWHFTAMEVEGRRIRLVRVGRLAPSGDEPADGAETDVDAESDAEDANATS